jgi:hypothetical protein
MIPLSSVAAAPRRQQDDNREFIARSTLLRGSKSGLIATGIRCAARSAVRSNRFPYLGEVSMADKAS